MKLARLPLPVVLDLTRLQAGAEAEIRRCCERLGAHPVDWRSGGGEPLPAAGAVVSALRFGERVIPPELLDPLERLPRRMALLLVTAEPLVAPAVALHEGLVVLVGERSEARVYGELRLLLLRAARGTDGAVRSGSPIEELRSDDFWCAGVAAGLHRGGRGLSVVLPLEEGLAGIEVGTLAGAVRSSGDPSAELASRLGTRAGFVGLSPDAREWLIYWPSAAAPLWFCSPDRLPEVVELGGIRRDADPGLVRLPAAVGDAVLALSRPAGSALTPPTPAEGAPAWLDRALEAGAAGPGAGALAIEVRS